MVVLAALGILTVVILLAVVVPSYLENRKTDGSLLVKQRNAELKVERQKVYIATKALRNIANGTSGLPVLDATNALDDLERLTDKELS
jgi:hypothetical protein